MNLTVIQTHTLAPSALITGAELDATRHLHIAGPHGAPMLYADPNLIHVLDQACEVCGQPLTLVENQAGEHHCATCGCAYDLDYQAGSVTRAELPAADLPRIIMS